MKKSQFITIFIMLIAASVLICIFCFLDDPKDSKSGTVDPTGPVEIIPTVKPYEGTPEPVIETPEPATETPEITATPTATPDESTPEPSVWPEIPFPVITNVGFVQYDTKFDHFTTAWKTGEDLQNRAVINARVLEIIKDIDYVFYTVDSETEWSHYMTFTLHYEYGYTSKTLDLLKNYNIKAVFFVTKEYIQTNPDLVRRMKAEGHVIGNRGIIGDDNIKKLTAETFAEGLLAVEQEYQKLFGATERMYLFRTDYFNTRLLKVAEAMGYTVVFRTYTYYSDYNTYKDKSAEDLAVWFNARAAYNGTVSEFTVEKKCYEALEIFIANCIDQGINFKLVERRH